MECLRRGIFILLYWFNVYLAVICKGDPCTDTDNIKVKQNETWRSPAYSEPNLREAKCDAAIVEGWYRIESETGNDMTMECVPAYQCGTHFPIWMNGTIPDESEGVVIREMCVSYHLGCCHHKFNINVQNCGDYRVYELTQTAGCAWAYCFGEIPPSTFMPSTTVASYPSNAFSSTTDTSKETSTRQLSTTRQHTGNIQTTTEKPSTTSVRNQPTDTSTPTMASTDAVISTTRDQTTFSDVSTRKSTGDEDPCSETTKVKLLRGQTWRSAAYSEANLRNAKCDAAIDEGWYRVESEAGNDTVTECVPTYRCGTHFPIWMNGTIPNVSEGVVTREMCVSYHLGCCHHKFNIRMQNCGDYRVYELTQTGGCAWAYCFGERLITTLKPSTVTSPPTTSSTAYTTTEGERLITTLELSSVTSSSTVETTRRTNIVDVKGNQQSMIIAIFIIVAVMIVCLLVGLAVCWFRWQEGKRNNKELGAASYKKFHNEEDVTTLSCTKVRNEQQESNESPVDRYDSSSTSRSVSNPIYSEEPDFKPFFPNGDMINQDKEVNELPNASSQENPYSEIPNSANNLVEYTSYPHDTLDMGNIDLHVN